MTQIFLNALPIFLLIFCRVTAFFVISPIFSYSSVPTIFKIALGFFISLITFTVLGDIQPVIAVDGLYVIAIMREVLIGLMLGYIVYVFFAAVHTSGGIIDLQMGFAMANVLDPQTGATVAITGNFKYMILMLVFLMMNGHHLLITGLMESFKFLPLDNNWYSKMADGSLIQLVIEAFTKSLVLGLQIATPVMVAIFITDIGLGFLAKTAPQFNVFVIGFAIKIAVGLLIMFIILPRMGNVFNSLFSIMFDYVERFFGMMSNAN